MSTLTKQRLGNCFCNFLEIGFYAIAAMAILEMFKEILHFADRHPMESLVYLTIGVLIWRYHKHHTKRSNRDQ